MDREAIEHYRVDESRLGNGPAGAFKGAAGGAPCGDLITIALAIDGGRVIGVRFQAEGCGVARAAAACVAELAEGESVIDAARIGADTVAGELGGLDGPARHGAELAGDALHRALGEACRSDVELALPGEADVLVAMSGGVDSAVAAELSQARGERVCAVTLKLWADERNDGERSCCSPEAVLVARRLAHSMGLPHLTLDLRPEFRAGVVDPFIEGYRAGDTPNPCVLCNGNVRLERMIALGGRLGGLPLATGHYARVIEDEGGPLLTAAADPAKDQSYMLCALDPSLVGRMRFPLAALHKAEVRRIARDAGLPVAGKVESQDLCFLAGEGRSGFLRRHGGLGPREGAVVDRSGQILGRHRGAHEFTVGQRRGIGVAASEPLYVTAVDSAANRVSVGPREEAMRSEVTVRDARLHRDGTRVDRVRLRYRSQAHEAILRRPDGAVPAAGTHARLTAQLATPAFAPAPGQVAALLEGDRVIGHATIDG